MPKVTASLIVGLLPGPHTLESLPAALLNVIPGGLLELTTIPDSHFTFLDPIAEFAMLLVLSRFGIVTLSLPAFAAAPVEPCGCRLGES